MRLWLLAVVGLTGCDAVWGLDELYVCVATDDDCDELVNHEDPCPADPGSDDDADGDRIGDACDPNPELVGDLQLSFEPFLDATTGWAATSGTAIWSVRDSAYVQGEIADGTAERLVDANEMTRQPTIEVVLDPTFGDGTSHVGVYVESTNDIPLECRIARQLDGSYDLVMLLPSLGGEIKRAKQLAGNPRDGLRVYGGQLPDGTIRCRARFGDTDGLFVDWSGALPARDTIDTIGLRTGNASAAFRSVTQYSVP